MTRRRLIGSVAATALLAGCRPGPPGPDCDLPSVSGVDWLPDVAHPVAWGEEHLTRADGAPRDLSIYYPSPRFIPDRPMLRSCLGRWPVVLFLHGRSPDEMGGAGYHRRWWRVPVALARSGYVVVVPSHGAITPTPENAPPEIALAMADIAWVRTKWREAKFVDQRPGSTAVVGHSYGAVLGARLVGAHPEFGAFASLGGVYGEFNDPVAVLSAIKMPSFFMFSNNKSLDFGLGIAFEQIDGSGSTNDAWPILTEDKYFATYNGGHFDYLEPVDTGSEDRGGCTLIGGVAADLIALFIASNLQSLTRVPVDLRKPPATPPLNAAQQALAIQHLTSIDRIATRPGCRVDLRWSVGGVEGARVLGPAT